MAKERMPVVDYTKELEAAAVDAVAAAPPAGGDFLGTKGGVLTYKGSKVPGNELEVCILDFIQTNLYYVGKYDADNPQPPVCYAFGRDAKTMAPHKDCAEPQAKTCADCPHSAWGSADTGKGKACQNALRLALVPAAALDTVADEDVAMLKVPVTSTKSFGTLVAQYSQTLKRPPFAMTTIIRGDAGALKQPFTFHPGSKIDDKFIGEIMEKRKTVIIDAPFPAPSATAPAKVEERKPNRFARK